LLSRPSIQLKRAANGYDAGRRFAQMRSGLNSNHGTP
jgi:hypothetical protein